MQTPGMLHKEAIVAEMVGLWPPLIVFAMEQLRLRLHTSVLPDEGFCKSAP